jgi:hypothetical protein
MTWPWLTPQMYVAQFTVTRHAASASSRKTRGSAASARTTEPRWRTSTRAPIVTSDQTMRCARISMAPAGSSSGQ